VASILVDLAMRDTMNQSRFFAGTLVQTLRRRSIKTLDSPHRYAGFAVLKSPDIPSILVEAGFMSNAREAQMLNEPGHRSKIASALKSGIDLYFERVRKNKRP
jgi:N-acetylmuramoyl-L-alanine amidase